MIARPYELMTASEVATFLRRFDPLAYAIQAYGPPAPTIVLVSLPTFGLSGSGPTYYAALHRLGSWRPDPTPAAARVLEDVARALS